MSNKITCHDMNQKTYEVDAEKLIFRPSVYGVLIEDNKVLLSKQFDGYEFPGGGVNIHETVDEALRREFFEETGLHVEVLGPLHCETTFFHPSHSKKYKNEYWNCPLVYFLVKKVSGELSTANFDTEEQGYADLAEWIDVSKLEGLKFVNSVDSVAIINKARQEL